MKIQMIVMAIIGCLLFGCRAPDFVVYEKWSHREVFRSCNSGAYSYADSEILFQVSISNDYAYSIQCDCQGDWKAKKSVLRRYDIATGTVSSYHFPIPVPKHLVVANGRLYMAEESIWVADLNTTNSMFRCIREIGPGICDALFADYEGHLILLLCNEKNDNKKNWELLRYDGERDVILKRCELSYRGIEPLGSDKVKISPDGKMLCVRDGSAYVIFDVDLQQRVRLPVQDLLQYFNEKPERMWVEFEWTNDRELTFLVKEGIGDVWCTYDVSFNRVIRHGRLKLKPKEGNYKAERVYNILASGVFYKIRQDRYCNECDQAVIKVNEDGTETELNNGRFLNRWNYPRTLTPNWYYD